MHNHKLPELEHANFQELKSSPVLAPHPALFLHCERSSFNVSQIRVVINYLAFILTSRILQAVLAEDVNPQLDDPTIG